jgi:superoxide reductase
MEQKEIWKCSICAKTVEIINPGAPTQVCDGKEMTLMQPKWKDWSIEKHVPHISIDGNKVTVDIGIEMGTPHPMTVEHWITWIELVCKNDCYKRKFLKPGDEPKVTFIVKDTDGIWAREYCNLHGLWVSEMK